MIAIEWIAALGIMGILGTSADGGIVEDRGSFQSRDRSITVERFTPSGTDSRRPAILILHGAGGLEVGGTEFRSSARELARLGYVAHIVHYFEQTGTVTADEATIARSFSAWMLTIGDALSDLAAREDVDPGRVGLLGFSLGSYLALSVAGRDHRVAAVVEYFGGLPDLFAIGLKRFPPTLILHGDADPTVPVSEARKLERRLAEGKFPHEIKIYPGQGHRFDGADRDDAVRRTIEFLEKHLKGAGPA